MPKKKDSRSGQSKAWRVQFDKRQPKSRTTNQAKPGGLSKIGAQQQDRKSARSQAASHLTGLMRKHVRVCGAAPKLQKTRKWKSESYPQSWCVLPLGASFEFKIRRLFPRIKRQERHKQSGFQHECPPKQWVQPLLLVFTGFQTWLHRCQAHQPVHVP